MMLLWNTTICVYSCIFIPTNTYSCTYINVKYLQFVRMEFSSLSVIRNRKGFLLLLFLFFLLPKFPILRFSHHHPLTYFLSSPHVYHFSPTQQIFNRQPALVFSCVERGRSGEWYWRNLPSKFQCSSQGIRPLILNTRQRRDSNLKIDWELQSGPSPTLGCGGPDYYGGGWGIGKQSSCSIWRKCLEMQSADQARNMLGWTTSNPELTTRSNFIHSTIKYWAWRLFFYLFVKNSCCPLKIGHPWPPPERSWNWPVL